MKIVDFKDEKAKKEGIITPEAILKKALAYTENTKRVIIVSLSNDGDILTAWSHGMDLEALGLLEVAKLAVLQDMRDPNE